ncbi:eukaryotic translation initiation factor 4 gamma 1 isoform X4 [Rhipicephalus sanguineus]|uniref:eukaryotic translation initiation factor 4 gamma 1 isoform X4 n=1 Tax=Rhipicephalus sanguineus TaxID=34632 RepID=UPI001894A66F|nr:eukaryotic translation initiation factor 4 gamma 1 isoform X4 [Rhipicephalus sanguineus]
MSLPQKSKYPGVSPNIAQQSRGPHTYPFRGFGHRIYPQCVDESTKEDYRLQHAYSLPRGGVGSAGGAHEMNKQALGSQPPPPGGLYLAQGPSPLGQGPPQQAPQPQHPGAMHVGQAYYQARQPQQVQQGPPQPPNPQAAPPQVQVGPQQVGAGGGRGPGGGGPPSMGRPPPLAQAAQLGLSPLGTPPGAPPQPPVAAAAGYPGALMPNFANQAAGYPAPQHMPQQPIILGNCMPYSQRPGQFNPAAQYTVYQSFLQPQQATQMYYNPAPGMVSVTLPGGGAPPQVQAPRGPQAYQQGAQQLPPRQRHILEIKDPYTGRNVLEDLNSAPAETTTPTAPEQQSGASDIAGVFAAQVAAAAAASSSGPPPTKVSTPPVLEPPPPPVEEVSPHEEVSAPVEERRETRASPTPPPAAASTAVPTELRGAEVATTRGVSTEEAAEPAAALSTSVDVAEAPSYTSDAESAVLAAEVVDTRNSAAAVAEGRTPVVVEEVAPAAAVTLAARKDAEETPAVPAKTPASVAASAETVRETTDGRESRKSAKKKKMKEWNKKGENKEGGDMDAFVDKEEQSAAQPSVAAAVAPEAPARTPTPPMRLSPAPPTSVATPAVAAVTPAATGPTSPPAAEPAPAAPAAALATAPTSPDQTDSSAGEDEQHRKAVKMKNEENLRVSREAAAVTPTATGDGLEKGDAEANEDVSEAPASCPAEDMEDGEENEEAEEEDEEENGSKESGDAKAPVLKYSYREDQWSPLNPEGRKQYDRQFLLMLQGEPMSLKKPFGLPNLDVIKDTAMQHKLPDLPRGGPYQGGGQSSMGGGPGGGAMGRGAHPEHLFMPPYARNGVARPPPGGGGGGPGRRQSQPGRGGDKPKKVITLSSSLNQDVKLHAAQNAWKPSHKSAAEIADEEAASAEELYRRVRGILNKLTPQKFQSLVEQVRNLEINSEERLNKVIDLVFEKALDEPNFSVPYANMCKHLAMFEVPIANDPEGRMVNFRKLLLLKCQKEFEKDVSDDIRKADRLKKIEEATSEEEKAKLMDELLDDEKKSKRRSLGNIRFIGELYNLNMLTAPIMFDCLRRLINSNDEDSLECLCKLLITIGKELDSAAAKGAQGGKVNPKMQLDEYFRKMENIVKKREVSLRVVFMLQDVIDLRQRKWIPRRDENIPKTIDQIHEEAQREQVNEELMRDSMPRPKRGEDRRKGGRAGGGGGFEDGWNTVPSKKHVDFNKLKQISTKQTEMDTIQLGPGSRMSSWAKGSSGGGKSSSQEPEGRPPGATNRFSALADAPSYDSRRGAQRSTASSRESSRGRGGSQQQSPMPSSMGARKTPSQSRERDAALAAVKNITSANAPAAAAAAPASSHEPEPASAREDKSREPDVVLRGPANMDEDTLKTRTEALVDQFLCNSDLPDAVQNVVELASPGNVHQFVSTAIAHTLERNPDARRLTGQLLKELLKRKVFSLDVFTKGLHEVLEYGEDMELDIPKVWEYMAELVSPLFLDLLALQYLRDATEPLRPIGRAGRLAACVLAFLAKTLGEAAVVNMWRTAGLQWSHFLKPGEDAEAFAKANGVAFTLGGVPATPSAGSGAPTGRTEGGSAAPPPELESQLNFLIRTKGAPSPTIIEWIESNLGDAQTKKPPFIRALVTAVAENAITLLSDGNAELKEDLIKSYTDLLQKYLNHDEERELQALYALQALVNRLEHPKGILVHLFNSFYDCDLISEDAFHRWSASEDLAEQEGKGVAIKSTTSFFTWLAEIDGESGDEN